MRSKNYINLDGWARGCLQVDAAKGHMISWTLWKQRIYWLIHTRSTQCLMGFVEWKWSACCWEKDGGKVVVMWCSGTKQPWSVSQTTNSQYILLWVQIQWRAGRWENGKSQWLHLSICIDIIHGWPGEECVWPLRHGMVSYSLNVGAHPSNEP